MVVRILDDAHMAQHALRRQQSRFLVQDGAEELVRGAEALHQDFALTVMDQPDRLGDRLQFVLDVLDFELVDIDIVVGADFPDQVLVTHEGAPDKTHVGGQGGRFDRVFIDSPSRHHLLADVLRLQFGEKVIEILDHIVVV